MSKTKIRLIGATAVAIIELAAAGTAQAQTAYYMRQRIVGMPITTSSSTTPAPTPTPTPTATPIVGTWTYSAYGTPNSTCSTTATSTRTASCTSGGTTVDNSYCTDPQASLTQTTSVTSGCSAVVSNGGFETNTTPWSGISQRLCGNAGYGQNNSYCVAEMGLAATATLSVSGLLAGSTYNLNLYCKGHNSGDYGNMTATVGGITKTIGCSQGWSGQIVVPFTATGSDSIAIKNISNYAMDFDNVTVSAR